VSQEQDGWTTSFAAGRPTQRSNIYAADRRLFSGALSFRFYAKRARQFEQLPFDVDRPGDITLRHVRDEARDQSA
jgi:hypothetical protein